MRLAWRLQCLFGPRRQLSAERAVLRASRLPQDQPVQRRRTVRNPASRRRQLLSRLAVSERQVRDQVVREAGERGGSVQERHTPRPVRQMKQVVPEPAMKCTLRRFQTGWRMPFWLD